MESLLTFSTNAIQCYFDSFIALTDIVSINVNGVTFQFTALSFKKDFPLFFQVLALLEDSPPLPSFDLLLSLTLLPLLMLRFCFSFWNMLLQKLLFPLTIDKHIIVIVEMDVVVFISHSLCNYRCHYFLFCCCCCHCLIKSKI